MIPSTGINRFAIGSTPMKTPSSASAPSRGGAPSSLNRTSVTISRPSTRSHVWPTSICRTSPCANRKLCVVRGSTPSSRKTDAGTEVIDAPVSTSASSVVQRTPFLSPILIGTLKAPTDTCCQVRRKTATRRRGDRLQQHSHTGAAVSRTGQNTASLPRYQVDII